MSGKGKGSLLFEQSEKFALNRLKSSHFVRTIYMKKLACIISGYFLVIVALFLYSYTQVDLSLTLSRASIFQTIEKNFQYIGYFNRPLSTYLFCTILGLLFIFYGIFLTLAKKKKISLPLFWKILLPVTAILTFSYNAFSYDFFNYIFYTKIILHYHQNPYLVTALDFPKEPMLSFMHWTHNTYPYGPFFLVLTTPLGWIGHNIFIITFFIFKIFTAFCYLGTVWLIAKILKKIAPEYQMTGTILYALNPLVLIESLVSAHNDVAMMFFAILGMYLLLQKKWIVGLLSVILSALTKQAMVFLLLPAVVYAGVLVLKKKWISERMFFLECAGITVLGYIFVITKIEIQPWYCLWFLPFLIFIRLPKWVMWGVVGYTLGVTLRYVPFLWQGDWNGEATMIKTIVTLTTPFIFLLLGLVWTIISKKYAKA